jgi:AAA family ATP:ADP antiporter
MLFNWVNTTGEYILDRTLEETALMGLEAPAPAPAPAVHPLPEGTPVYLADREGSRVRAGTVAAVAGDGGYRVEAGGQAFEGEHGAVFPRTDAGRDDARKLVVGSFKARFFLWVNLLGVLIQLFLVSRVFKYLGVGVALFILPAIALFGYSALAFAPVLALVRAAKIAENSTDYSVQNTARHALFLPVSREAKFSAKAAIDTFVVRAGDVLSAVLVFAGISMSLATRHFAMVNLALVVVWLGVVIAIAREHRRRTAGEPAA